MISEIIVHFTNSQSNAVIMSLHQGLMITLNVNSIEEMLNVVMKYNRNYLINTQLNKALDVCKHKLRERREKQYTHTPNT